MTARFAKSFLLSLNLHVWGIGLLSLAWALSGPKKPPDMLEVKFFKMPREVATVEGTTAGPVERVGVETKERSLVASSVRSPQRLRQPERQRQRQRERARQPERSTRKQRGFLGVEYRVKVAKKKTDAELVKRGSMDEVERENAFAREGLYIAEETFASAGVRPRNQDDEISFRGDTRPILEIIQSRIDAVTPLAHASAPGCNQLSGIVRVAFQIDRLGYPCGMRITRSSGNRCLDREVHKILHMAEPYPYLAGWVPVTVRFVL